MKRIHRPHRRQSLAAAAITVVLSLVLSACGGSSSGESKVGGDLTISVPNLPARMAADAAAASQAGTVLIALEPLLRYTPSGELEPALAEKFEQPDPTTYVFTIREGVTFWDGSELTPKDVVESLKVHMGADSTSSISPLFAAVKDVEATGASEVTLTLSYPNGAMPLTLAMAGIFSSSFAEKSGDALGSPGTLNMGTGPYKFTSFKPDSSVTYVRNDSYWGDKPKHKAIDLRTVSGEQLTVGMQSSEFDAAFVAPPSLLDTLSKIDGYKTTTVPYPQIYAFSMAPQKGPWKDENVRQAFARVVNRTPIAESTLDGANPALTLVSKESLSGVIPEDELDTAYDEITAETPTFDVDEAKKLMAASDYPDGFTTELVVVKSDPSLSLIAQTVAQDAEKIGITIKVRELDETAYNDTVYFSPEKNEGLTLDNGEACTPDPIYCSMLHLKLFSAFTKAKGGGYTNTAGVDSADIDKAIETALALPTDDPTRIRLALEALALDAKIRAYVPVAFTTNNAVYRDSLSLGEYTPFWWMTNWADAITSS